MHAFKKITAFGLAALLTLACAAGCASPDNENSEEEALVSEYEYPTCEMPDTLKLLMIGNSFSEDSMEYLYDLAVNAGIKNVIIGNAYVPGCSLEQHLYYAENKEKKYIYFKNVGGRWEMFPNSLITDGLQDEDWDFITIQEQSSKAGQPDVLREFLPRMIEFVQSKKTNPDAKLLWNATWAYQADCTDANFSPYDYDQMTMYNAIIGAVKDPVMQQEAIEGFIPLTTAVQNLRTSFVGDQLCRDRFHMSFSLGQYTLGMTFLAKLTGADISEITYAPCSDITPEVVEAVKEAVTNAIRKPYEVTESSRKTGTYEQINYDWNNDDRFVKVEAAERYEKDKAFAAMYGKNLDDYELFEYTYTPNSYYSPSISSEMLTEPSIASRNQQFATPLYTREELPVGSFVMNDDGWTITPASFEHLVIPAPSVPRFAWGEVHYLSDKYWGECEYMGFTITLRTPISIKDFEGAASHIRIYVPKK